jgi:hypothetical protein
MKAISWSSPSAVHVTEAQHCLIGSTDALLLITRSGDEGELSDLEGIILDLGCDVATYERGDRVIVPALGTQRWHSAFVGYTEYISSTGMKLARVPLAEYNLLSSRPAAQQAPPRAVTPIGSGL